MTESNSQILQACPSCATLLDVTDEAPFSQTYCPSCGQSIRARSQFNNFQLLEILGEGGMGSVFKAVDQNLRRLVALKILKKEFSSNEEERKRLETEARLTASINHPHVVKLYSFGQDHGQFYMAMELVEKGSLDDLISLQQKVPEAQVLEVGIQIAQGLEAALERGLIHRDIKPGNILFSDAHTAKIVDFGLATPVSEEASSDDIWGTPYYIAPEKLNNQPEDFRSDMYSLGASLFHALAGRPPFEAQTASLVALKHIKNQAVSLQAFAPHVSSETAYVINRTLSKNPDDRYASYEEFIEHLQYARARLLENAGNTRQKSRRVVLESQKQRQIGGLITLLLLLAAIGLGGALFFLRDQIFVDSNAYQAVDMESAVVQSNPTDDLIAEARELVVEKYYEEALSSFQEILDSPDISPLQDRWVKSQMGLVYLLLGKMDKAQDIMASIGDIPFSLNQENRKLSQFFINIGRTVSSKNPVNDDLLNKFSNQNYESFALLLFGLKNGKLSQSASSKRFLQAFIDSDIQSPNDQWILKYVPIAKEYLRESKKKNK